MKQRTISGALIALFTIVPVIVGGPLFYALMAFIMFYGTYEFISVKKNGHFSVVEYVLMILYELGVMWFHKYTLLFSVALIIFLLTLAVFNEKYTFDDISGTFLMAMLLGLTLYYANYLMGISRWAFGLTLCVSYLTDTFALFSGMLFGKHKLNERISPKKTIEGSIGGWIIGSTLTSLYAYYFGFFGFGALPIIGTIMFMCVFSQIGDLSFSLIKRHYGVKDFSNLIPGHGGLLDRLDSLSFCIMILGVLISYL